VFLPESVLIHESKRKRVRSSHEGIFTLGADVPWIFMQGKTCQEARCSLGSGHGERVFFNGKAEP
jgi:hypothetical protein